MPTNKLKVLSLEASNVLRLRAIQITPNPDNNVVILGGENEQGKSSALACIEMAIGGKKRIPASPVHLGEKEGRIKLMLGQREVELIVERTGEKLDKLVVRSADGAPKASPQAILDALKSDLSFDPLAFERMEPAKQVEMVKKLLGLDFTALDSERAKLYEKRTEVGRGLKVSQQRVADFPISCVTAPDTEVDIGALLETKKAADEEIAKAHRLSTMVDACACEVSSAETALAEAEAAYERAQQRLADAQKRMLDARNEVSCSPPPVVNLTQLHSKLSGAEAMNRLVRAKRDRAAESAKCAALEKEQAALTERIAAIDADKQERLTKATWPVPGLGFGDGCLTYDDLPLSQASAARRRQIAFEMACALNPGLAVVLLPDASLLGKEAMKHIAELAAAKDMQVWVERVGAGDPGAIIFEDGGIRANCDSNA
jgi:DNA repair exonuclease SbcCD ATPase subunit